LDDEETLSPTVNGTLDLDLQLFFFEIIYII